MIMIIGTLIMIIRINMTMIMIKIHRIIAGAQPHLQERQYSAMEQLLSVIDMVEVTININTLIMIIITNIIIIIIIIIMILVNLWYDAGCKTLWHRTAPFPVRQAGRLHILFCIF